MVHSNSNYVSVGELIADVTAPLDDRSYSMMSKGWYISQVQQALQELSFDTHFDVRRQVFDMPSNLKLELPAGAFNIKEIKIFSGTECTVNNSVNVWYKRNMTRIGDSEIVNGGDIFYGPSRSHNEVFYADMYDGMIVFDSKCRAYNKVLLVFNGVSGFVEDVPIIPLFLREAVKMWVLNKGYEIKCSRSIGTVAFNQWRAMKIDNENRLFGGRYSEWDKVHIRVKSMTSKQRRDFNEYLTKINS